VARGCRLPGGSLVGSHGTEVTRVLIVEDDPVSRHALDLLLRGRGYDVTACADADEADSQLALHAFDVLVTDDAMPPGRSGWELVQDVLRARPRTLCIVVSGSQAPPSDGSVPWLSKPVDARELVALIERHTTDART
jgi:CheY-like chemotaxis protein